jgi:hypothetical protein
MSVAVPVKKVCVVLSRIVSTILRRQILGCVRCQRLTIVLSSFSRAHVAAEPLNLLLLLRVRENTIADKETEDAPPGDMCEIVRSI